MLTEAGAALGFVSRMARVVSAKESGDPIDEEREFRAFCRRIGVEPTDERYELAADAGTVVLELVGADAVGAEVLARLAPQVPLRLMTERLEVRGWRKAFLEKPAGDSGR